MMIIMCVAGKMLDRLEILDIYMFSLNAFEISLIRATGCCEKQQKKEKRKREKRVSQVEILMPIQLVFALLNNVYHCARTHTHMRACESVEKSAPIFSHSPILAI